MDKKPSKLEDAVVKTGCISLLIIVVVLLIGLVAATIGIFSNNLTLLTDGLITISIGLVSWKIRNFILKIPAYTDEDLLLALNSEWKTSRVIADEMAEAKGIGDSWVDTLFRRPDSVAVSFKLIDWCKKAIVEYRVTKEIKLDGEEEFLVPEFRLTGDGFRKKDELLEKDKSSQGIGFPRPQRV